jgi:hypothetical protein
MYIKTIMYRPQKRTSVFAAHSSVMDLPPLAAPDEEMAPVLTAPIIRYMQRDAPQKKKSKPRYLPGEKLLKKVGKLNTPNPEPEEELDLDMIQNSINTVLERMRL